MYGDIRALVVAVCPRRAGTGLHRPQSTVPRPPGKFGWSQLKLAGIRNRAGPPLMTDGMDRLAVGGVRNALVLRPAHLLDDPTDQRGRCRLA